jgi:hypothetical protein
MKGNLRDFSGTQILNLVSLAKKTGTLAVDRKDGKANLIFKDGKLIYAAIGDADGTLASVLARDGRISKEQADALAKRSEKTGDKQLGLLLIQKGYVSQADIIKSIRASRSTRWRRSISSPPGAMAYSLSSRTVCPTTIALPSR